MGDYTMQRYGNYVGFVVWYCIVLVVSINDPCLTSHHSIKVYQIHNFCIRCSDLGGRVNLYDNWTSKKYDLFFDCIINMTPQVQPRWLGNRSPIIRHPLLFCEHVGSFTTGISRHHFWITPNELGGLSDAAILEFRRIIFTFISSGSSKIAM